MPRDRQGAVPQIAFQRLVREATRMTAQHLAEVTAPRRLALLVAVALHLETALTDATLSMFDKLMGSLSRRAERRSEEEQAARSAGELRVRLRTLASSCCALIAARDVDGDLEEAIEQHMGWARFIRAVDDASLGDLAGSTARPWCYAAARAGPLRPIFAASSTAALLAPRLATPLPAMS